jgi:hypothetical protein
MLTNSHILSHLEMRMSYPGFTLVSSNAWNNVNCLTTLCGLTLASASTRAIVATVSADGVGVGLGREKMEPIDKAL